MERTATIQIIEYGPNTIVNVEANERVQFSLNLAPKKFDDPEVLNLRKIVESQRGEITRALEDSVKLSAANDALSDELRKAKRTIKNGRRGR